MGMLGPTYQTHLLPQFPVRLSASVMEPPLVLVVTSSFLVCETTTPSSLLGGQGASWRKMVKEWALAPYTVSLPSAAELPGVLAVHTYACFFLSSCWSQWLGTCGEASEAGRMHGAVGPDFLRGQRQELWALWFTRMPGGESFPAPDLASTLVPEHGPSCLSCTGLTDSASPQLPKCALSTNWEYPASSYYKVPWRYRNFQSPS